MGRISGKINLYVFSMRIGKQCEEVMSLSCVVRCDKVPVAHSDVVYSYDYEYTLSDGSIAKCGDWIVRDVYDKYSVMTDEEYQKHINDKV